MPPFEVLNRGRRESLVCRTSAESEVRTPSRQPGLDLSAEPSVAKRFLRSSLSPTLTPYGGLVRIHPESRTESSIAAIDPDTASVENLKFSETPARSAFRAPA